MSDLLSKLQPIILKEIFKDQLPGLHLTLEDRVKSITAVFIAIDILQGMPLQLKLDILEYLIRKLKEDEEDD